MDYPIKSGNDTGKESWKLIPSSCPCEFTTALSLFVLLTKLYVYAKLRIMFALLELFMSIERNKTRLTLVLKQ